MNGRIIEIPAAEAYYKGEAKGIINSYLLLKEDGYSSENAALRVAEKFNTDIKSVESLVSGQDW